MYWQESPGLSFEGLKAGTVSLWTCARAGTVPAGSLSPLILQAAASLRLASYSCHRMSLLCTLGGHVSWYNTWPQRLRDSRVFPINFSKYNSFLYVILWWLDKAYLILSCVGMLGVGHQKKSEKSGFFWWPTSSSTGRISRQVWSNMKFTIGRAGRIPISPALGQVRQKISVQPWFRMRGHKLPIPCPLHGYTPHY